MEIWGGQFFLEKRKRKWSGGMEWGHKFKRIRFIKDIDYNRVSKMEKKRKKQKKKKKTFKKKNRS